MEGLGIRELTAAEVAEKAAKLEAEALDNLRKQKTADVLDVFATFGVKAIGQRVLARAEESGARLNALLNGSELPRRIK